MEKSYWYFEKDDRTEAVEGNGWRLEILNEEFYIGKIKIFAVLFIYDSIFIRILFFSSALLLSVIFRFFFRTVFFYLSGSQSLFSSLHRRIILGSQDELSNYFSWKIPRIPRVYLQFIDLSDNKPDAWFIFKTRQYVK